MVKSCFGSKFSAQQCETAEGERAAMAVGPQHGNRGLFRAGISLSKFESSLPG